MFFLNIFQTRVRIRMLVLFETGRDGKMVIVIDRKWNSTSTLRQTILLLVRVDDSKEI